MEPDRRAYKTPKQAVKDNRERVVHLYSDVIQLAGCVTVNHRIGVRIPASEPFKRAIKCGTSFINSAANGEKRKEEIDSNGLKLE